MNINKYKKKALDETVNWIGKNEPILRPRLNAELQFNWGLSHAKADEWIDLLVQLEKIVEKDDGIRRNK